MDPRVTRIVEDLAAGKLSATQGLDALRDFPSEDLGFARVDHHRWMRKGLPEVVYGAGKTPSQIVRIVRSLKDSAQPVLVTRLTQDVFHACGRDLDAGSDTPGTWHEAARAWTWSPSEVPITGQGTVVIAAAGTSDLPVAEEAAVTARHFGNRVERLTDVGVAGLHRLLGEVPVLRRARVVIAVAGMEGALPSVIAGLVACPVIAVPTSVGYGASLGGLAALLAMLNSCATGVTVVNIDNGFGAASAAHLINHPVDTDRTADA